MGVRRAPGPPAQHRRPAPAAAGRTPGGDGRGRADRTAGPLRNAVVGLGRLRPSDSRGSGRRGRPEGASAGRGRDGPHRRRPPSSSRPWGPCGAATGAVRGRARPCGGRAGRRGARAGRSAEERGTGPARRASAPRRRVGWWIRTCGYRLRWVERTERAQSSSGHMMVMTGPPSSPAPIATMGKCRRGGRLLSRRSLRMSRTSTHILTRSLFEARTA